MRTQSQNVQARATESVSLDPTTSEKQRGNSLAQDFLSNSSRSFRRELPPSPCSGRGVSWQEAVVGMVGHCGMKLHICGSGEEQDLASARKRLLLQMGMQFWNRQRTSPLTIRPASVHQINRPEHRSPHTARRKLNLISPVQSLYWIWTC